MTRDNNDHEHASGGEIVTTKSVNSEVITEDQDVTHSDVHEGRAEPYGHVMLMDWDDASERKATKWAGELPGVTVVLESSEGSYHAWNLCVASLKDTALKLLHNHDDRAHITAGHKRGYWRLRFTPKHWDYGGPGEEVYKSAPELVTVTLNETDREQSLPHYNLAAGLYDLPEAGDVPYSFNWVGDSYSTEQYETMTDEAKERFAAEVREGGD